MYNRSNQFAREEQKLQWLEILNVNINGRSGMNFLMLLSAEYFGDKEE